MGCQRRSTSLPGGHWTVGLHGKNLTNTKYKTAGYNFLFQNPYTGESCPVNEVAPFGPALGGPQFLRALGREGVLSAFLRQPAPGLPVRLGATF